MVEGYWRNPIDNPRTPGEDKLRNDALHAIQPFKREDVWYEIYWPHIKFYPNCVEWYGDDDSLLDYHTDLNIDK